MIGVGAGAGLLVVILVVVLLIRGGGDEKPAPGAPGGVANVGPDGQGLASGTKVVFEAPLPPEQIKPGPPNTGKMYYEPAPTGPPEVWGPLAALLPVGADPLAQAGPIGPWKGGPDPPSKQPPVLPADAVAYFTESQPLLFAAAGAAANPFAFTAVPKRSGVPDEVLKRNPDLAEKEKHRVIDLRTGKAVGWFARHAPVWWPARLSPDGWHLVGPDNEPQMPATRKDGTLFVWKREQETPVAKLTVPGPVSWMEFVAADRLAILTFDPEPVLQLWAMPQAELVATVRLPNDEFAPPARDPVALGEPKPTGKTYAPDRWAGAVSPGGRYLALAGRRGAVLVTLADKNVVGTLPTPVQKIRPAIPPTLNEFPADGEFRGISFSPDGEELRALIRTDVVWVVTWSLATGRPTKAISVGTPGDTKHRFRGAPLPGPTRETLILPARDFGQAGLPTLALEGGQVGGGVTAAALIDSRTGAVLRDLSYVPIRETENGKLLAVSILEARPQLALPPDGPSDLPVRKS